MAIRLPATDPPQACCDLARHRDHALLVDVDQRLDQPDRRSRVDGELGQRQRVLGKAGPAEARPGIEEAGADPLVESDAARDVDDVGVDALAQVGDLVDERHFHRQKHVGGVFDHFGAAPRGEDQRARDDAPSAGTFRA